MRVYHGTSAEISRFVIDRVGSGDDEWGPGLYFTDDVSDARRYATRDGGIGQVYVVDLELKNPLDADSGFVFDTDAIRAVVEDSDVYYDSDVDGRYLLLEEALRAAGGRHVVTQLNVLFGMFFRDVPGSFFSTLLHVTGFDGLVHLTSGGDGGRRYYVAWFEDQVRMLGVYQEDGACL